MELKGLSDKYNRTYKELYNKFSETDAHKGTQPFLEIKPTSPTRNEANNDTRSNPVGSVKRDIIRIGKFLKSSNGMLFTVKQALLQTGNTFSQTRVYNPATPILNTVPFIHARRSLSIPSQAAQGRLQKASNTSAIARAINPNTTGGSNLLNIIGINKVTNLLNSIKNTFIIGSLGKNERPELSVNNDYYFYYKSEEHKQKILKNISQKISILTNITNSFGTSGNISSVMAIANAIQNPNNTSSYTRIEGYRYYAGKNKQLFYVNLNSLKNRGRVYTLSKENPQEIKVEFGVTGNNSIDIKYSYDNDIRYKEIRDALTNQNAFTPTTASFDAYFNNNKDYVGYPNYGKLYKYKVNGNDPGPKYMSDPINILSPAVISQNTSDANLDDVAIQKDIIPVIFFDFVNKTAIQFRAFVNNLTENVNPTYVDTKYIGAIERHVVYTGVVRDISFDLQIFAFSKEELNNIWEKINYLTGLCFPSSYDDGYLVPPLTKLTIGNLYKNQTGYLSSISNKFTDFTWDIDSKIPFGITATVNFNIIEKIQHTSKSNTFYNYTSTQSI